MGLKGRGCVRFASCEHFGYRSFHLLGTYSVQFGRRAGLCFLSSGWKLRLHGRLAGCDFCRGVSSVMPAWPSLRTHLTAKGARGWDLPQE